MPSTIGTTTARNSAKKPQTSKGKRKGKKKEDEAKRKAEEDEEEENETEFQRVLLEIRVNELETLILGLKRKCDYLESQNNVYKTQLQETRQEKEELVAYLERSWKEEKVMAKVLEEKLIGLHQTLGEGTKEYEQRLQDKETEFEMMKSKLDKQILEMEIQLNAIEEYRIQKNDLQQNFEDLSKELVDERQHHQIKYEELENELIRYKDKMKKDTDETIRNNTQSIQKTLTSSLPGAVKSAIAANVKFRYELETVSKDNLDLRGRLQGAKLDYQQAEIEAAQSEKAKSREKRKAERYKHFIQLLLEKQSETDKHIGAIKKTEKALIDLQNLHSKCKSDEEINNLIKIETKELIKKNINIQEAVKMDSMMYAEFKKLQNIVLNVAIAAKEITEAESKEEYEFLSGRYKTMVVKIHETACEIQNLSPEMKSRLIVSAPKILPYLAF